MREQDEPTNDGLEVDFDGRKGERLGVGFAGKQADHAGNLLQREQAADWACRTCRRVARGGGRGGVNTERASHRISRARCNLVWQRKSM